MSGAAEKAGVSERAAQTVKPAKGKRRPLADACPRCEWCGEPIPNPRPNKRFCDSSCRGKHCHARKGRRPGRKALQSATRGRKRDVRRKHGTDLYVVREEIELVRDLLTGKPAGSTSARARLLEKIPRALERIERRAAA